MKKGKQPEMPRLLTADLISLGCILGGISEILRAVEDQALERKLSTKEEGWSTWFAISCAEIIPGTARSVAARIHMLDSTRFS
jgi:hypothetical protein